MGVFLRLAARVYRGAGKKTVVRDGAQQYKGHVEKSYKIRQNGIFL